MQAQRFRQPHFEIVGMVVGKFSPVAVAGKRQVKIIHGVTPFQRKGVLLLFSFKVKRDYRVSFFKTDRHAMGVTNVKFQHLHVIIFDRVIVNLLRFKKHAAFALTFKVDHAQQILHLVPHDPAQGRIGVHVDVEDACD